MKQKDKTKPDICNICLSVPVRSSSAMEARPGGWGQGRLGAPRHRPRPRGRPLLLSFLRFYFLLFSFLPSFSFSLSFFFFPPIFSAFNSTKAETVAVSEVSRQGPRGWVHQPWAHPSSPSLALPVPGPLEHLSAYARRAVPIHSPPPPWMLELSPELGGALQPDPGSHLPLCSCHVFFRKRPLSQPQGQRERPGPGLDHALERPFGPRAQGPACQAPSGPFLAFIPLPTPPPGKWEQPVAWGVGGMSL